MRRLLSPFQSASCLGALGAMAGLSGCVPQATYDDLMNAYRSQEQQLLESQSELETSRANEQALRNQLEQAMRDLATLGDNKDAINARLDALMKDYESLYGELGKSFGVLPEGVNEALKALADQYRDLLTYDEARGMLRFNSDFTFDSGSVVLKSEARQLIPALANIMNSSAASGLEAHIIGHTDNVPVSNPNTLREHKNNVYLSAHRAISVRDALVGSGVSPGRFLVAGFGEYRPAVPNPASGGIAANRRVEIFFRTLPSGALLPSGGERSSGSVPRSAPVTPKAVEEPLK